MNSIPTSSCDINLCFLNTHSNSYLATRGVKHINGLLLNFLQDRYGLYIIPLTQICILVYSVYAFWFVLWTFKIFSTLFKNLNSGERDGRVGGGGGVVGYENSLTRCLDVIINFRHRFIDTLIRILNFPIVGLILIII